MEKTKSFSSLSLAFVLLFSMVYGYVLFRSHQNVGVSSTFVYNEITETKPVAKAVSQTMVSAQKISVAQVAETTPVINVAPMPILPPRIVYSVTPAYPETALQSNIEGAVVVDAKVGALGNVESATVKTSSGSIDLDNSAVSAVSQWKFSPATQGGQSLSSVFEVPVRFAIKG